MIRVKEIIRETNCGSLCCGACEVIEQETAVTLKNWKELEMNENVNCKTEKLIYSITFLRSNKNCNAKTGKKLTSRVNVNKNKFKSRLLEMFHVEKI